MYSTSLGASRRDRMNECADYDFAGLSVKLRFHGYDHFLLE